MVAHRDPVVPIPDIFDAWIVEDRLLYHRHFASLAWQAGASFTEILRVDAVCTIALKADGAGGAMFLTVDDAADCTGLRALHAEEFSAYLARHLILLAEGVVTIGATLLMLCTQEVSTGVALNATVPTEDAPTGSASRIHQKSRLLSTGRTGRQALCAVGPAIYGIHYVEAGAKGSRTAGAGHNTVDTETLPTDGAGL
jgi:hypothetical protein